MAEDARVFPNRESLYQNQRIESMPWYNESLGADLERELDERKILEGASINRGKTASRINFVADDILHSGFKGSKFDFIFDRGCFHVISPKSRLQYVNEVRRIMKEGGLLFLKCFSDKEQMRDAGPYRFSADTIRDFFAGKGFEIQAIKETAYQGTLNPLPKSLFVVMAKIKEN